MVESRKKYNGCKIYELDLKVLGSFKKIITHLMSFLN